MRTAAKWILAAGAVAALLTASIVERRWADEHAYHLGRDQAETAAALLMAQFEVFLDERVGDIVTLAGQLDALPPDMRLDGFVALARPLAEAGSGLRTLCLIEPDGVVAASLGVRGAPSMLGLNLIELPLMHEAVERALGSDAPSISGVVPLDDGRNGVWVFAPAPWGSVCGTVQLEAIREIAPTPVELPTIRVSLSSAGRVVHTVGAATGETDPRGRMAVSIERTYHSSRWEVTASPGEQSAASRLLTINHWRFRANLLFTLIIGGGLLFALDVMEQRRRSRRRLISSERMYRLLFGQAPVGILHFDSAGAIVDCNEKFVDMMGSSRDALIGFNMLERMRDQAMKEAVADGLAGQAGHFEGDYLSVTGNKLTPTRALFDRVVTDEGEFIGGVGIWEDITEHRRAENALRESERRYRGLFEQAPLGILHFDADGVIVECNRKFINMMGSSPEALIGFNMLERMRDERMRAAVAAALDGGVGDFEGEYLSVTGGKLTPTRATFTCAYTTEGEFLGGIGIWEDMSESKRAEQERDRLFNLSVDMFCIGDLDGRLRQVNPAFTRTLGWDRDDLSEWLTSDLVHRTEHRRMYQLLRTLRSGRSVRSVEMRWRCKDGSWRWTSWSAFPVRDENLILAVGRDIHERKAAEAERARLEEQLRHAQKMEAVGKLAASIAHDLNNLLAPVIGYADIGLLDVADGRDAEDSLEEIRAAASRARALTSQLLAFGRKQVLDLRPVDLSRLVEEFAGTLRGTLSDFTTLDLRLEPAVGTVMADAAQIEQVLMNLAVNARDAMPEGGTITISTRNVELDEDDQDLAPAARPGPHTILSVSDSGHGMDDDTLERAIEPFFTTKGLGKGTGLGLATVHGTITQHGGSMRIESRSGEGTTVAIYLPHVDAVPEPRTEQLERRPQSGTETVLVVEDHAALRVLTVRMLQRMGYRAMEAAGAAEALSMVRAGERHIDLLLTDVAMPLMDGTGLYKQLLAFQPDLKVIYMSGYADTTVPNGHGSDAPFLQKPFTVQALSQKVREVLDG